MKPAALGKRLARAVLPLAVRRRLAAWIGRRPWLGEATRYWWVAELLRDYAQDDPDAYHRFLWSHHLGYAHTYDASRRFGPENINATRRMRFDDMVAALAGVGTTPAQVDSVLEVGCSLGYLLRHLETAVFVAADRIEGIDIDAQAIAEGRARLTQEGSRVRLHEGDMTALRALVGERQYDVVYCAGTLMYLREAPAADVVAAMLGRTKRVLALAGLAHPERDNAELTRSEVRSRDGTWVHNLDAMVVRAGGRVLQRRWEGARQVDGNTVYFVVAAPGQGREV